MSNTIPSPEQQAREMAELRQKEQELYKHKVTLNYNKMKENLIEQKDLMTLSFGPNSQEYAKKIVEKSKDQLNQTKKRMQMLKNIDRLNKIVPLQPYEMILIGAKTGTGKTTACLNIVYTAIISKKRALVITNEETATDFYSKLACLFVGTNYPTLAQAPAETQQRVYSVVSELATRVKVVDADYGTSNGLSLKRMTNTVEGISHVAHALIKEYEDGVEPYDLIIFDYYQNVNQSLQNPTAKAWECQEQAAALLEKLRTHYPAPVVVLSQMKKEGKDEASFADRIEGRKVIANYATVVMELLIDRKSRKTDIVFHKGRNMEFPDQPVPVGWENGLFVEYTQEFAAKVARNKLDNILNKKPGEE